MVLVVGLTKAEMVLKGFPEWLIKRITTRCAACPYWTGACNPPTIMCYAEPKSDNAFDIEYGFTIQFWLLAQKIKHRTQGEVNDRSSS